MARRIIARIGRRGLVPPPAPPAPPPVAPLPPTPPPPGSPPPNALQILVNNERVKLTTTTINAVAVAFIIGGGANAYSTFGADPSVALTVFRAALWIGIGGVLHWVARKNLRNLL